MTIATTEPSTHRSRYRSRRDPHPVVVDRAEPVVWGGVDDGPLDADELRRFDERGLLRYGALFSAEEITELHHEARRLAGDATVAGSELAVREPGDDEVRSVFAVHQLSDVFAELAADERLAGRARQVLGSDVYLHQTRVNLKPGFRGREFYWHSDFETWHLEDGMPGMRCLSVSLGLTENTELNGGLMVMPGSHKTFVGCVGETPDDHYKESLREQRVGTPDDQTLTWLAAQHGIELATGDAGAATFFDCNAMHGSNGNITPYPRSNVFLVYSSVHNTLVEPFGGTAPRPDFIAHRTFEPLPR